MVCNLRADLRYFHGLVPGNADRVVKAVCVPKLEEGHIQADVRGIEPVVFADLFEKAGQVFDVVHCRPLSKSF